MGRAVWEACKDFDDMQIVCGIDPQTTNFPCKTYPNFRNIAENVDAVIDFSAPSGLKDRLNFCEDRQTKLVVATTGFSEEEYEQIRGVSRRIPILLSANLCPTIFLFQTIAKKIHEVLQSFDVEIIEKHHNQKKDAPSGTAKVLSNLVKNAPVHSLRGGTITGEHSVCFFGQDEEITLTHRAYNRSIFAKGALQAVRFLALKDCGLFSMQDLCQTSISSSSCIQRV